MDGIREAQTVGIAGERSLGPVGNAVGSLSHVGVNAPAVAPLSRPLSVAAPSWRTLALPLEAPRRLRPLVPRAPRSPLARRVKRAIDVVGAALGLVASAPIIAASAVAIRLDSRGPVFFRQARCGRNGRLFSLWKLRTMDVDAEARKCELLDQNFMDGPVFKVEGDPRVTRVGRILRRYSIDELPQLWNVLTGEMSLVGPRPPLPSEVAQYGPFERKRLRVRPGLTCEWQVSGRNRIGFTEWVRLDVDYIENWSLARDVSLLLRTIPAVLRGNGAS
jgi:lipopolysaccharide/colanic/teichoic acid biosynthesis glycosyltransferase